jgi:hypothetical protein
MAVPWRQAVQQQLSGLLLHLFMLRRWQQQQQQQQAQQGSHV